MRLGYPRLGVVQLGVGRIPRPHWELRRSSAEDGGSTSGFKKIDIKLCITKFAGLVDVRSSAIAVSLLNVALCRGRRCDFKFEKPARQHGTLDPDNINFKTIGRQLPQTAWTTVKNR